MTGDVVTRLREGKGNDIELFKIMDEAADEIELLRADRDRWRRAARLYRLAVMHYDEAVRGE